MSGWNLALVGSQPSITIDIVNDSITDDQTSGTATAIYQLNSNGNRTGGTWIQPVFFAGAAYEARATLTAGTFSTGTAGSWLSLGSTRTWTKSCTGPVCSSSCTFTLEIRRASDGTVLDTATIQLTANVAP